MHESFMLAGGEGGPAVNLPESQLLYKRPASHARGVSEGLNDFADITTPGVSFALSGPSLRADSEHLPVRGDLAHIRLAGKVFVPHYVVPMPFVVNGSGADLRTAGKADAELMETLPTGALFYLLDTSGGWAWGQVGEDGLVGYVPFDALKPAA